MANTNTANTFRSILQSLICDRYRDASDALAAIDEAFEAGRITNEERGKLSRTVQK